MFFFFTFVCLFVFFLIDALEHGTINCLVCIVDTDVVVTLIGKFCSLLTKYLSADVWVSFLIGKNYAYLHINVIGRA